MTDKNNAVLISFVAHYKDMWMQVIKNIELATGNLKNALILLIVICGRVWRFSRRNEVATSTNYA